MNKCLHYRRQVKELFLSLTQEKWLFTNANEKSARECLKILDLEVNFHSTSFLFRIPFVRTSARPSSKRRGTFRLAVQYKSRFTQHQPLQLICCTLSLSSHPLPAPYIRTYSEGLLVRCSTGDLQGHNWCRCAG